MSKTQEPPPRSTIYDRVKLGTRVVAARHLPRPDTWATIAKREGVSVDTCQRAYNTYVSRVDKHEDPTGMAVIDETLQLYEELVDWLTGAMEDADLWTAKMSASRQLVDLVKDRIELLVVSGKMPRNIVAATDRQKVQVIIRRMAEVLDRNDIDPAVVRELLSVLDDEPRRLRALPAVVTPS